MFITSYRLYIIIESISLVIIIRVFIKYLSRLLASIYNLCVATELFNNYNTYFYTSVASAVWC